MPVCLLLVASSTQAQRASPTAHGRVTDARGLPLEGVDVTFVGTDPRVTGSGRSGVDGSYVIKCGEQQYGRSTFRATGFRALEEEAFCGRQTDASRRDVTFLLGELPGGAGGTRAGVVSDEAGEGIADASVWITGVGTSQLRQDLRSQADGAYTAALGTGGDYVVSSRYPGFKSDCRAARVDLGPQNVKVRVELVLRR